MMKKFSRLKHGYLTTNSDTIATNNRTLADFPKLCGFFPKNNRLLSFALFRMLAVQSEKEIAEPGNSNNLYMANKSTPSNRAIFVCSTRTPKENNQLKIQPSEFLSMVACNGKGSPFAVFHVSQFSSLLHVTAQTLESLAVALQKSYMELLAMLFKFLSIQNGKALKITVRADSEEQARIKHGISDTTLCVARYTDAFLAKKQAILSTEQNHSLPSVQNADNLESTTTFNGNRNRYTSGIFLPKIHQINGSTKPLIYSELAVRATPRNKADTIRTNKGDCLKAVVEPLSHPFSDKPLSLTRTFKTMKKPTQTPKGTIAKLTAFPFVLSAEKGACYA